MVCVNVAFTSKLEVPTLFFKEIFFQYSSFFFFCIEHCAVTFDTYTDKHKHRGFNTYTHHYINDDWQIESRVLKTSLLDCAHTAQNLCNDFNDMTKEYGLSEKKIVCVTDSAPNMVAACRLTGNRRIPCIAHKANTMIQKDLMSHPSAQPIQKLLKKIREGQTKLIYRHGQLQKLRDDDNQKKFALLMSELSEIEEIYDAEEQFQNYPDESIAMPSDQDFSGLKTMNEIRWNCILKFSKCYLENSSE